MEPLISIIIPTLNSEKYLKKCLDSVLYQSYKNLEVIIVDGGSTDKTIELVKDYCLGRDNWILLSSSKGVSHQRNEGLNIFKGEYLFFLDSDDYINQSHIYNLYKEITDKNLDVVTPTFSDVTFKNNEWIESKAYLPIIIPLVTGYNFFEESYRSFLAGPIKLYKRDILNNIRFNEELQTGEDLLFNYEIAKRNTFKYGASTESIYYYRQNIDEESFMNKRMNKKSYSFCNMFLKIIKDMKNKDKNYYGAIDILGQNLIVYIKSYVKKRKIVPLALLRTRFYMFMHSSGKLKYFYLFPRSFSVIYLLIKKRKYH